MPKNIHKNTNISSTQQEKKSIMSGIQSKITRYAKKLKNTTPTEEDNQPIQTDRELAEIMEIADKDFKSCNNCIFDVPL